MRGWADLAGGACAIGAGLFVLVYHLILTTTEPLNFDEAYNLQVPLNLYLNGVYQSWYEEPLLFPHQITTGPAVLLPIAGLFAITGPSYHAARAIMTLFMVGYLWQVYSLSRQVAGSVGNWAFAVAAILFVFVPLAPWLSSIVLGELPGVVFLLFGVNAMGRAAAGGRRSMAFCAGVMLGLAVLCKVALLICAAGALLAFPLSVESVGKRREAFALGALAFIGLVVSVLGFEAVKMAVLGYARYKVHWFDIWRLMKVTGSGLADHGLAVVPGVARHIEALARAIGRSPWQVSMGLACVGAVTLVAVARRPPPFAVLSLAFAVIAYWIWWLDLSASLWIRHLLPGYILFTLLLAMVGARIATDPRFRRTARAALLAALILAVTFTLPFGRPFSPYRSRSREALRNQEATARLVRSIRDSDPHAVIWGYGWYQSPEISFLAQLPFRDITREAPSRGNQNYLLIPFLTGARQLQDYAKRNCTEYIARLTPIWLCRLRPDAPKA